MKPYGIRDLSILQPVEPVQRYVMRPEDFNQTMYAPEASIYKIKLNPTLNPPLVLSTPPHTTPARQNLPQQRGQRTGTQLRQRHLLTTTFSLFYAPCQTNNLIGLNNNATYSRNQAQRTPNRNSSNFPTIKTVLTPSNRIIGGETMPLFGWETYTVSTILKV